MPAQIISGGQTGADRAALDFALAHGIPCGGWCPKGRWAEDGIIPARYPLKETLSANPVERTEWNVRDADATVIFSIAPALTGGSRRTAELANQSGKPCLHLSKEKEPAAAAEILREFLVRFRPKVLNIAGPRASDEPEICAFSIEVLTRALIG